MRLKYLVNPEEYSEVIYGDSVTGDTPLILRNPINGMISIETIQSLGKIWVEYPTFKIFDSSFRSEKQYSETYYEVWTDLGWSKIKKVIKHKTDKKIYKVSTHCGIVKVTEDHSLLDENCKILKPKDCRLGTKLLSSYPTDFNESCESISKERAFSLGSQFGNHKIQKVPVEILNSKNSIIKEFLRGYGNKNVSEDQAGMYYLYKKLGYNVSLYKNRIIRGEKNNCVVKIEKIDTNEKNFVYDLETECGRFGAGIGDIIVKNTDSCMIKLKTLSFDKFVDMSNRLKDKPLLTEKQKEELQELKTKVLEESFEKGKVIAQKITEKLFKKPIELEFEKVYHPYILLSKKRYISNLYGSSPYKPDKIEKKGIVLSRRDNANIVKRVYTDILNPLLNEGTRGINISISILRKYINDILKGEVDINDLLITKTLTKTYGKPCKDCHGKGCDYCKDGVVFGAKGDYAQTNSPHVQICINKRKKDPGSAPVLNDRISYVFVNRQDKPDAKLYEKAEELETVIEEGLEIDYLYYIQNQIQNPLTEILKLIVPEKELEELFSEYTKDLKTKRALAIKQIKIKRKIPKNQTSILKWVINKEKI